VGDEAAAVLGPRTDLGVSECDRPPDPQTPVAVTPWCVYGAEVREDTTGQLRGSEECRFSSKALLLQPNARGWWTRLTGNWKEISCLGQICRPLPSPQLPNRRAPLKVVVKFATPSLIVRAR
jgi:hypothetical protein